MAGCTIGIRAVVTVELRPDSPGKYPVTHPYVRRYWTALLGPTSVADLLRMVRAAERSMPIRRPHNLSVLLTEGLVTRTATGFRVASTIGEIPSHRQSRLPLFLRAELKATRRS